MKKNKIFIVLLTFILLLFLIIYLYQKNSVKKEQTNDYRLEKQEIAQLKEGDIILRHGFGIISDMIVKISNDSFPVSHCGILCRNSNQTWVVIHTVSNSLSAIDGIRAETLPSFIKNSKKKSIIIVRYKNANDSLNHNLTTHAYYYLNKHIPFDDRFDTKDTTEFYCTEFIRQLFLDVYKTDIYQTYHQDILDFEPFYDTNLFKTVFSHQVSK